MKYKVGNTVCIKSMSDIDRIIDSKGCVGGLPFKVAMNNYCSSKMTIDQIDDINGYYRMKEDPWHFYNDEMIEGLAEESDDFEKMYMESKKRYEEEYSKGEYCHEQSFKWGFQEGYDYAHENDKLEINLKNGYEFKDDNGNVINAQKIVLEKKKKEYPKSYEECAKVLLDRASVRNDFGYKGDLLVALQRLLVCRDAYWKIAGEEMGLGKPWQPDCNSGYFIPAIIYKSGSIQKVEVQYRNAILAFPTPEMRDAFKENFDPDIEICKEFL